MKVAVLGATGTVGRALVPVLAADHEVVAVSRHPSRSSSGVEWRRADVGEGDAVRAVLEGVEVAYYLVHSLGTPNFEEQDRQAAVSTARAAEAMGVRQLVYLGGLSEPTADLSPHLRSRAETGDLLASGRVL